MKRSERYLENKELRLLPYSRLSVWPSGVLVEALLRNGGGAAAASGGGGKPPPSKDEKGLKEWIRNKLKALALLLGR